MKTLRIATRKSPLALWQTEHVAARLRALHPDLDVRLIPMSTRGDEVLDRSLSAVGGKGLFLKELELAMLRGDADCAVHSLKDVPMDLDGPFALPAILERADHADAFVSNHYDDIAALPPGARVGSSSLRRQAQLRALRPDLELVDLRGNVNTRLSNPSRCRPAHASRMASYSPASSFARRVLTLPRRSTSSRSGRSARSCACRRSDELPTRAPCGNAAISSYRLLTKASA